MPVIVCVQPVEDPHHDCVCVPLLELWRLLEELQAWVLLQQVLENRFEIFRDNRLRAVLGYDFKELPLVRLPVIVRVLPKPCQLLLVYLGFATQFRQRAHFLLYPRE